VAGAAVAAAADISRATMVEVSERNMSFAS